MIPCVCQSWFLESESKVASLSCSSDPRGAGRLAASALADLDGALGFDAVGCNVQVKKCVMDAKECLHHLIRLAGVKEEVLVTLQGEGGEETVFKALSESCCQLL